MERPSFDKVIFVTGGAGFIGSTLIRHLVKSYPNWWIVNIDKITYAGNLENLKDVESEPNYAFIRADICDYNTISKLFFQLQPTGVIHLAAESHVDRSIENPFEFATTNVLGTLSMLQAARTYWESLPERYEGKKFYHVSTDEVYGALDIDHSRTVQPFGLHKFSESYKYDPHSPYSASKASSDHFVRAYKDTYGMPTVISNCSNNYGPYQFPEKLIPLVIQNIIDEKPIPIYGEGLNVRDWLYVEDHAKAIETIFIKGKPGETYLIGGNEERRNVDVVNTLIEICDEILGREPGYSKKLITYVKDRAGHDLRYAIDAYKLKRTLNWSPTVSFEEGIRKTVEWYINNKEWLEHIKSGEYQDY